MEKMSDKMEYSNVLLQEEEFPLKQDKYNSTRCELGNFFAIHNLKPTI
jgi:hypothetical protein